MKTRPLYSETKKGTILKQRPEIKSQNLFWAPWKKFAEFAILMVTDF